MKNIVEKEDNAQPSLLKRLLVQSKGGPSSTQERNTLSTTCVFPTTTTVSCPAQTPPTFSFPPALLAANPSLAQAAPGSIVVVASPNSIPHLDGQQTNRTNSANQQLLHVFMVSDEKASPTIQGDEGSSTLPCRESTEKSSNVISHQRLTSTRDRYAQLYTPYFIST